jgi:hypothetical protein
VSTHRAGHDARCERSTTKPGRCTCRVCGGNLHGVEANRQTMLRAREQNQITEDEYTDWLERIRATGALQ